MTLTSGRGLMSTANGNLDQGNLGLKLSGSDQSTSCLSSRSGPVIRFLWSPLTAFQDAFSGECLRQEEYNYNDAPAELWNPVPGCCGLRFYLPVPSSQCLLAFGILLSPVQGWILEQPPGRMRQTRPLSIDMAIAWKIDGVLQEPDKAPVWSNTARYQTICGNLRNVGRHHLHVPTKLQYSQRRTAAWYDMHMLKTLRCWCP